MLFFYLPHLLSAASTEDCYTGLLSRTVRKTLPNGTIKFEKTDTRQMYNLCISSVSQGTGSASLAIRVVLGRHLRAFCSRRHNVIDADNKGYTLFSMTREGTSQCTLFTSTQLQRCSFFYRGMHGMQQGAAM
eukprot:1155592-Pelagomonas_calceolata.AAC.3